MSADMARSSDNQRKARAMNGIKQADDALNEALRSGDKDAISQASMANWDAIRRDTVAKALRGPSDWTPPSLHRVRVIEVHPEVVAELRDLLFEEDMLGVGYSEFIQRAIEAARGTGLRTDNTR